jgi:hypothetical protein
LRGQSLIKRTVARLAIHVRVRAFGLGIGNIRVAALARLVPGKLHRVLGNLANRRPAIVPVLPEGFWNHVGAHHQKHQEGDHKEPRKPEKMSCILHETLSPYSQRREEAL